MFANSSSPFRWTLALTFALSLGGGSVALGASDPVEDLKNALATKDESDLTNVAIAVSRLSTIPELQRSLQLAGWGAPTAKSGKYRIDIAKKLLERVKDATSKKASSRVKQAIAALIGSLGREALLSGKGAELRIIGQPGYVQSRLYLGFLAKSVVKLLDDDSPQVRIVAARALGNILLPSDAIIAKAKEILANEMLTTEKARLLQLVGNEKELSNALTRNEATKALGRLSEETNRSVAERRAAAGALRNMVRLIQSLSGDSDTARGVQIRIDSSTGDTRELGIYVVVRTAPMLADADVEVNRLALNTIERVGFFLRSLPQTVTAKPGSGALPPLVFQMDDVAKLKSGKEIAKKVGELLGSRRFQQLLTTRDVVSRLLAWRSLEHFAGARRALNQQIRVARRNNYPDAPTVKPDYLAKPLEQAANIVAKNLDDPSTPVRLAGVQFLELLEDTDYEADQSLAVHLADRLRDRNKFVRWASIRALGNLGERRVRQLLTKYEQDKKTNKDVKPGPDNLALLNKVVNGLIRLLGDRDIGVRMAAATSLEKLMTGAESAPKSDAQAAAIKTIQTAGPALADAGLRGDADPRAKALEALKVVGLTTAEQRKNAARKLATLLLFESVKVRQAAAEAIGSFGSDARVALPALERALRDIDPEVRQAASDAILNIETPRRTDT